MKKAVFDYPPYFTTLPEYTAHAGQEVEVIRPATEKDGWSTDIEQGFLIRAADGWEGFAYVSELKETK